MVFRGQTFDILLLQTIHTVKHKIPWVRSYFITGHRFQSQGKTIGKNKFLLVLLFRPEEIIKFLWPENLTALIYIFSMPQLNHVKSGI